MYGVCDSWPGRPILASLSAQSLRPSNSVTARTRHARPFSEGGARKPTGSLGQHDRATARRRVESGGGHRGSALLGSEARSLPTGRGTTAHCVCPASVRRPRSRSQKSARSRLENAPARPRWRLLPRAARPGVGRLRLVVPRASWPPLSSVRSVALGWKRDRPVHFLRELERTRSSRRSPPTLTPPGSPAIAWRRRPLMGGSTSRPRTGPARRS